jgi:hypothetical protein
MVRSSSLELLSVCVTQKCTTVASCVNVPICTVFATNEAAPFQIAQKRPQTQFRSIHGEVQRFVNEIAVGTTIC